jgi:hypothetical protein
MHFSCSDGARDLLRVAIFMHNPLALLEECRTSREPQFKNSKACVAQRRIVGGSTFHAQDERRGRARQGRPPGKQGRRYAPDLTGRSLFPKHAAVRTRPCRARA